MSATPVPATRIPDAREVSAQVDEYMKAAVQYDQFSGSILVARNGVPVFLRAYGMANYEVSAPNTAETVFCIASLTKQFTATAILQLHERGKLNVGDPICDYLDDCPAAWHPITIRHLLTHTSGIPNYSSLPDWDEVLALKTYTHSELVALFRNLPLQFVQGEKFKYTNSGYYLLGLIIERASGKAYRQYLQDRIFAPLGMKQSGYNESRSLIPNLATGYYSLGTSFINARYVSPTTNLGASGIYSTVGDMLRWDQALYSDTMLSPKLRDEMFTPFLSDYGYGWQIGEKFGRRKTDHSGSDNGFSTYIVRFPADRMTVIVLSNSDRTSAGRVGLNLSAIVFGAPYKLPTAQLRDILWDTIANSGIDRAVAQYRDLRKTQPGTYDFGEDTLLDLGFDLFDAGKISAATKIFELSLAAFPRSSDSLYGIGAVAEALGDTAKAIAYFEKSLAANPTNRYSAAGLVRLRKAGTK